jgi:hypothetical protein
MDLCKQNRKTAKSYRTGPGDVEVHALLLRKRRNSVNY